MSTFKLITCHLHYLTQLLHRQMSESETKLRVFITELRPCGNTLGTANACAVLTRYSFRFEIVSSDCSSDSLAMEESGTVRMPLVTATIEMGQFHFLICTQGIRGFLRCLL